MNSARVALTAVASVALLAALTGCRPEPVETPEPTQSSTSAPAPSESPTPTPTPTPEPVVDIELPESCEAAYSADVRAQFEDEGMPLNDPGLTMLSTELVDALELMDTVPTLRCTWGVASEVGIATNISIVTDEQRDMLETAYTGRGLACEPVADDPAQTRCSAETVVGEGDGARGELEIFRGNVWVTTMWLNIDVDGYADDMVSSLWG
ncbi:MAG: hypothetical protein ACQEW8_00365 [Actinomycetota bacterium]